PRFFLCSSSSLARRAQPLRLLLQGQLRNRLSRESAPSHLGPVRMQAQVGRPQVTGPRQDHKDSFPQRSPTDLPTTTAPSPPPSTDTEYSSAQSQNRNTARAHETETTPDVHADAHRQTIALGYCSKRHAPQTK